MLATCLTGNRTKIRFLCAAVLASGGFLGHADGAVTIPYSETFESSGTTGGYPDVTFTSPANNWSIVSGGAQFSISAAEGQLAAAAVQVTPAVTTPITVSTTFNVGAITTGSDVGLAIFGDSADFALTTKHYLLDIKPRETTTTSTMRIIRVDGTSTTSIVADTRIPLFDLSSSYQLIVEATPDGGELDLKLTLRNLTTSAETSISGTDTSPLTGSYFGLRARLSAAGTMTVNYHDFNIVPEPATLGLLALGAVVMASRRRKA